MREIKKIIIHHSLTFGGDVEFMRHIHIHDNGWQDCGYHYIICNGKKHGDWQAGEDGEIQEGRPVEIAGAHARGSNADSIGICLIGNFMENEPSRKQLSSLTSLLIELCDKYDIKPMSGVLGHKDINETSCPGIFLYQIFLSLRVFLEGVLWYGC